MRPSADQSTPLRMMLATRFTAGRCSESGSRPRIDGELKTLMGRCSGSRMISSPTVVWTAACTGTGHDRGPPVISSIHD